MVILNIIMIIICTGILFTLRMMRTTLRPIEKMVYYMVIVIAIEQIHSAILDNLKLIKSTETLSALFFFKLNQLIVFPVGTLWLLFSFFHSKPRFLIKMLFLGGWFIVLTGSYILFQHLGILKLTGWNFGYSIVVWYVVLIESLCFSLVFRKMLGKCDNRDTISTRTLRR
ncbi:MAG: hypothetical protein K0S39_3269 [Paenibacillus sp.]|nr:hypothetical protein [Paenibacillus sp.]